MRIDIQGIKKSLEFHQNKFSEKERVKKSVLVIKIKTNLQIIITHYKLL
jgi:hypothetical protein